MVVFYKLWKKHNEIKLTKNKMELNNRKIKNHPPSPAHGNSKINKPDYESKNTRVNI